MKPEVKQEPTLVRAGYGCTEVNGLNRFLLQQRGFKIDEGKLK